MNHNGSLDMALRLIDCAAEAAADAVKFQTFKAEKVVTAAAPRAAYQIANVGEDGSQIELIRNLQLDESDFYKLAAHAAACNIEFMSTPFDLESLQFLVHEIGIRRLKIPSGEITNIFLLLGAARSKLPLIVSTGMCTLDDIEAALDVLAFGLVQPNVAPSANRIWGASTSAAGRAALMEKVTLLHCTTEYPSPVEDTNLRAMQTMRDKFNLPVGYSDHTSGIAIPVAAAALGATVIEKHFTLDRSLPGPDHPASLEPTELKSMVQFVRKSAAALGRSEKLPAPSELKNIPIARRSLVAARSIRHGETLDLSMLDAKRPGTGLSPMRIFDIVGTKAKRDYAPDEAIES